MSHCDDCGTKLSDGICPNCCEEIIIEAQYINLEEPVPERIATAAAEQRDATRKRITHE